MTKILKYYMTRTAVNSPSNPVSQKVFNDMLYAASVDVYQMAKKEQHTSLERKTLANYYARSIYRTTPFGLFSAVEFHNRNSENNKESQAVQYLVRPIIKSEATYKITTLLSKTHFKELKLLRNDNALEKSGNTLLNIFPIVDKRKDVIEKSIDDNFLVQKILEKIGDDGVTFNSLITDFREIFPEYLLTKIINILIDSHFVLTELNDEQSYTDPNVLINKIDSLGIKVPLFIKDYFSRKTMTLEEFSTRTAEDENQWFYSQFGTKRAVSYLLEAEASQRYDSTEYDNKILRFCNFLNKHAEYIPSTEFESDYMWIIDHYGSAKIPLGNLRERIFEDAFLNEHINQNTSNAISEKIRSNYQKYIKANKVPLKELFRDVENTNTKSLVDPTFQLCFNISQSGMLQLSPAIGTRGIGSIEGRFSRINPKEFLEIITQKNKYLKELGVTPVSVKLLNVPRFFSLTSDIVDSSELELSINLIGTGRETVKLDELYVQAINGQILIFRKRKSDLEFELIKVEANNMANWQKIYPPIIQKLFLWSERYFRNVLFPIDIIIKEQRKKVHNPAVFFEDILLLCENWNPIIEIGEGLDRKSFTSKIKNFIKKYSIPKKVALVSGDQHILVSLNELGISQLWSEYKKIGAFTLENNPMFLEISSKSESNNSINLTEYILNIVNSTNDDWKEKTYSQYVFTNDEIVAENLVWTEYDIYLPKKHQDDFICSVFDLIRDSLSVRKTFFIKYFDQRSHIRLRVQATEQQKEKLWFWLLNCYRNNVICDVVIRLYIPETSRYGAGNQLERIHEFFCQDSSEIVENIISKELSRDEKLQAVLLLLLDIISASSAIRLDKIPVMNKKLLKKNIWREDWDRVKANISDSLLTDRSMDKKSAPRFRALKAYFDNFNSTNSIDKLFAIQSLIHMTINRAYGIKAEEEGELNYFISKIITKYRFEQNK